MKASHTSPRYQSHPDDVFHADVRRPKDRAQNVLRHNQSSSEEEAHRKLCGAVIDGHVDVLRSLLVVGGIDANVRNNRGDTAGHQAAIEGRVDEMAVLICHGLDVDAVNDDGNTALHLASIHGTSAVAQCLAEAFPNEELRNHRGLTALDEAVRAGHAQCTGCIQRFGDHGKAQALQTHRELERVRLDKLRRKKEILYGRDLDVLPREGDFRGLKSCSISASDKASICISLQATAVTSRCVAAGVEAATLMMKKRKRTGKRIK